MNLADLFTQLTPTGEQLYQQSVPPAASMDYDMRGAWSQLGGGLLPPGTHYPDTFKLPNHPTFSAGSRYASPEQPGGNWAPVTGAGQMVQLPDGRQVPMPSLQWAFMPSSTNLSRFGQAGMQDYFDRREPTSLLLSP